MKTEVANTKEKNSTKDADRVVCIDIIHQPVNSTASKTSPASVPCDQRTQGRMYTLANSQCGEKVGDKIEGAKATNEKTINSSLSGAMRVKKRKREIKWEANGLRVRYVQEGGASRENSKDGSGINAVNITPLHIDPCLARILTNPRLPMLLRQLLNNYKETPAEESSQLSNSAGSSSSSMSTHEMLWSHIRRKVFLGNLLVLEALLTSLNTACRFHPTRLPFFVVSIYAFT